MWWLWCGFSPDGDTCIGIDEYGQGSIKIKIGAGDEKAVGWQPLSKEVVLVDYNIMTSL